MGWDYEDSYSEYESVQDQQTAEENNAEESYNDIAYEEEYDVDNRDDSELTAEEEKFLGTALVRLDQARLYEMLINHDLFEGVEANEISLKAVKREIKQFMMARLDVLLGLNSNSSANYANPFNDIEVQTLKDLAFAASKGATQRPAQKPVPKRDAPKPLASRNVSRPTQAPKPIQRPVGVSTQRPVESKPRPQQQKPKQRPVLRGNDAIPAPNKPIHEMTDQEKEDQIRASSEVYRNRVAKPINPLPVPTVDQQVMQYASALNDPKNVNIALARGLGGMGIVDVGDGD